ncbi:MAG: cytochrome P450 [Acidimicrobiia bacterium]|nr:cytochrome P450 [Acidimicrobiia bacterium]
MSTTERPPVQDWTTDFDVLDEEFRADPGPFYADIRARQPLAHTERWGGAWMPTRYDDVSAIAYDTDNFSSADVGVLPFEGLERQPASPPITSDPPDHTWHRRLILPYFSPRSVDRYEKVTRALCQDLMAAITAPGRHRADAAVEYAQQIPPRIIAQLIGVPESDTDIFIEWVRAVLENGPTDPDRRLSARKEMLTYFFGLLEDRKRERRDDITSFLLDQRVDGEPLRDGHIVGTMTLLLVAGIDTTWSSIGSAILHLATHPDDRRRLVAEPELIDSAVEEFLRAYGPVTMARVATNDVEIGGRTIKAGDKVLLTFPAANRDPEHFEQADEVVIDRAHNRHVAFGVGIHRCAGSNLARMEMRVAIEEWLAALPEFELDPDGELEFAGGQVRGPRALPVVY